VTRQENSVEGLIGEYVERQIDRRQFFKRAAALGVSLGAAGTLLAACGGGGGSTATTSAATGAASEAGTTAAGGTTSEGGTPIQGGTLREGYDRDVSRPDPVNALWWDPFMYPVLHETLIATDPNGKFVPMLAESWQTSSDGLTWTFTLRDGLTFQTGAPCDAAAVATAMNVFRSKIATNAGFWTPVKDVTALDAKTVTVTMSHPYADFPFVLNNGYSAIYNNKTREELGDNYGLKETDGTGAFKLAEFVPGSHCTVARWDGYPGSIVPFFENKGKAYLDGIVWNVLLEPATRAQEIESGNIDTLRGPAPQDVARLKSNDQLAVITFQEPAQYVFSVNFKETKLGFDNVQVRQAFTHAVDREAIAKTVFFDQAVPSFSIVQPAWPYYDPGVEPYGEFDPEMSKSLLDQAGWTVGSDGIRQKNGQKLSFQAIVEGDKLEQLIAQAVQQMLKDIGVDMSLKVYGADFFDNFLAGPQAYFFKSLWTNLFDASLLFLDSKYFIPSCCNATYVSIPALDAAFDAWQQAGSEDELKTAASKAQLVAAQQVAFIPIVTPLVNWVHTNKVHGWMPTELNLYPFYNDVWIQS
jgi:peptide/nickel transport system substrate-binding protein